MQLMLLSLGAARAGSATAARAIRTAVVIMGFRLIGTHILPGRSDRPG
jgi:hypothetical protein